MGALVSTARTVAAPKPSAVAARVQIDEGLAVIQVDGRLVLINTREYLPSATEDAVVLHWDGTITIDRTEAAFDQYRNAVRLRYASPVNEGPVVVRRGVTVLGRVVRYLN